ncbi:glycosyltransferase family 2 protein [Cystobacter fuscus]
MAPSDCFVSVVAPISNDAPIVESFVRETLDVLRANYTNYELVLVDDGSTDDSVQRISELLRTQECVRLIRLSRHFGDEVAISSGLDSVIGDFVAILQPDSDPPALIPEFVARARAGHGVVYGVRTSRAGQPFWQRMGARLFYWVCIRLLGVALAPDSTDFRVLSRQALNAVTRVKDRNRYLRIITNSVGFASSAIAYEPVPRRSELHRRTFWQSVGLAWDIMVTQSTHPLRMVSGLGLGASTLNLAYMLYVGAIYLFKPHVVEGWTTLSLQASTMFFLVFLILTVLCEYIGRILEETRERPLYHVLEERNSNVLLAQANRTNVVDDSSAESMKEVGA